MKSNIQLTHQVRSEILDRVKAVVLKRFYDPRFNGLVWPALVAERRDAILDCGPDQFERAVNKLLRELKASHVGFLGARFKSASARQAISATLIKAETSHGARWRFQDVHRGGAAHNAGIMAGDILLTLGGREVSTSESPAFAMGESIEANVVQSGMKTARLRIDVPDPRSKKQPVNVPQVVTAARVANGLGLIKISMFPGMVGIDVATRSVPRPANSCPIASSLICAETPAAAWGVFAS